MRTILKNVLQFSGLVVAVPVSIPHQLNVNGIAVIPQLVAANAGGFTISADTVNVTVTRTTGGADVNIYVEHWHTLEAVVPLPGQLAGLVPFVINNDGGGGGGSVPPKLYTVYVGKNGDDLTADGSIAKPFLTIQAAMDFAYTTYVVPAEPQTANPFTRPCVFVNAGTYDDGPLVLPPQICVMGEGFNHTRIVGDWTIDARWTEPPTSDLRSGWLNVGVVGNVTVDFNALSSPSGKLYAMGTRFFNPIGVTQANNQVNSFECKACDFFGDLAITGCETTLSVCTTYGTTITLNQSLLAGADNKFKSSGGSLGNIVVNSTSGVAPPYDCTFAHSAQPGATLTLNGPFSIVNADLSAVPLQALVTLAGGANLNQVFRINQLNWSGTTADRPPTPYVGQQYFDKTINKPVWWDGTAWISWSTVAGGRFDPVVGVNVPVSSQTGQYTSPGVYVAVGVYTIHLNVLPGVTTANDVFWTGNAFTQGHIVTLQPGFSAGHATVGVRIVTDAGVLVDDGFYLQGELKV